MSTTLAYLDYLQNATQTDEAGWIGLTGLGILSMLPLLFLMGVDLAWVLFALVWLIRKKMHINADDNSLYLP